MWPFLWASSIFATSCTVVGRAPFVKSVGHRLPVQNATVRFDHFWDGYWWLFVKGWHATEYAILFALIRWAWPLKQSALSFLGPLAICTAYAATDEFHQTFVPLRGGNVRDVLIDTSGAVVAAGISYLAQRRKMATD